MASGESIEPAHDNDGNTEEDAHEADAPLLGSAPNTKATTGTQRHSSLTFTRLVLLLVGALALVFESGNAIRTAPLIAIYKEKLCTELSLQQLSDTNHLGSQSSCHKDPEIQRALALVLGVAQFLECLPMLLLSGVYGSLADRFGRRPILLLGYLGMTLSSAWVTAVAFVAPLAPLRLVLVGPIFTVVGGGPSVPISILMITAADVVSTERKVTAFAFVHAIALVAVILGSFGSTMMMPRVGNVVPLLLGLALMGSCLVLGAMLPNTRQHKPAPRDQHPGDLVGSSRPPSCLTPVDEGNHPETRTTEQKLAAAAIAQSFQGLWNLKGVFPLLFAGFISMLGQQVQVLLLQYMPSRFDISLTKANLFNILNSGINLLVLLALLPLFNAVILRCRYTTLKKDLILAHTSGCIFIIGAMILGLSPSITVAALGLTIFSFGIGLSSLLRAIFVELFPPADAAFATTLISTAKSVGGSLSGVLYSTKFALSLSKYGILKGLPFFMSACCFLLVECALTLVPSSPTGLKSTQASGGVE